MQDSVVIDAVANMFLRLNILTAHNGRTLHIHYCTHSACEVRTCTLSEMASYPHIHPHTCIQTQCTHLPTPSLNTTSNWLPSEKQALPGYNVNFPVNLMFWVCVVGTTCPPPPLWRPSHNIRGQWRSPKGGGLGVTATSVTGSGVTWHVWQWHNQHLTQHGCMGERKVWDGTWKGFPSYIVSALLQLVLALSDGSSTLWSPCSLLHAGYSLRVSTPQLQHSTSSAHVYMSHTMVECRFTGDI